MTSQVPPEKTICREESVLVVGGFPMLALEILLAGAAIAGLVLSILGLVGLPSILTAVGAAVAALIVGLGFFTLQPGEAGVRMLFGKYCGTTRQSGFLWTNPFIRVTVVSVRARNLNGEKLKVNDKRGNPIEIAAVVVWRVRDTAQASFEVNDYKAYVAIQSESAVRHVASSYAYDDGEPGEVTLRGGGDAVSAALTLELHERLAAAGVSVDEARITHLAYAPEIAQAMLRRQQAEAVIAARQKIVSGAVSMVQAALNELADKKVVELDEERKAAMVSNLLVVLCGEAEVHPVVNTGTLYT